MEVSERFLKPVCEMKYTHEPNYYRYKLILRYFYINYEQYRYWLDKEEIYDEVKKHNIFEDYTMELLESDLNALVDWKNLMVSQDSSRINSINEYKNKRFKYMITEATVEIERLLIKLENPAFKNSSLEPTLLERLDTQLRKFNVMATEKDINKVSVWWDGVNEDFKQLIQRSQDYISDFYTPKAEKLMKSESFLTFKNGFIEYLRTFIQEMEIYAYKISSTITEIKEEDFNIVINKIYLHEKLIPRLEVHYDDEFIYAKVHGRWNTLKEWFIGAESSKSDALRLLDMTNDIIRKITRFACQIVELRNSYANRKEEYKKIAMFFSQCKDISEAHRLSAFCIGIMHTRHIQGNDKGDINDYDSGIYEETPITKFIMPRHRRFGQKRGSNPIRSKSHEKRLSYEKKLEELEAEKLMIEELGRKGYIDFADLPVINERLRRILLKWLMKAKYSPDSTVRTEYGKTYQLIPPPGGEKDGQRCSIRCEDGTFDMPSYKLQIKEEKNG